MAKKTSVQRLCEAPPTKEWLRARAVLDQVGARLRRRRGVVGVDIGPERRGGRLTGQLAIRVHVIEKIESDDLSGNRVLPDEISGVPVDVISIPFQLAACAAESLPYRRRRDPLFGAYAIRPTGVQNFGTIGAIFVLPDATLVALTCSHVVMDQVGVGVHQPSPAGGTNLIGEVMSRARTPAMDVALVRVNGTRSAGSGIHGLGQIKGILDLPDHAQQIPAEFVGACSGRRSGLITSADFNGSIGDEPVRGHLVIEPRSTSPLGRPGDSGSIVVVAGQAVGVVRAVSEDASGTVLASRIKPIVDRFRIQPA